MDRRAFNSFFLATSFLALGANMNANASTTSLMPGANRITFRSEGETLVGHLYLPATYKAGDKLPAVVVTGSWTTVKEQMAGTYARKLAEQGFAALAFDFRFFGESGGQPRQYESPAAKVRDIQNAVSFLESVPAVDRARIGGLSICASAGYMAIATAEDRRIKSYVAVAPWLHDAELVKAIYGGEEGVARRMQAAAEARKSAQPVYVPAISTTDENAAMFGPFEYYLDAKRGAIPQWKNQFAVQSWAEWLTFTAMPAAPKLRVPVLMVHSEEAAVPQGAKAFFGQVSSPKEFIWMDGNQFDFYDQPKQVAAASRAAVKHLRVTL